jgi:uncharacterized protein (DUF58 family)
VTTILDARVRVYVLIAALGLSLAVLAGRPELALFGAPFVLALVLDLAQPVPTEIRTRLAPLPAQVVEGDELTVALELEAARRSRVEVVHVLPPELELLDGRNPAVLELAPGTPQLHELRCRCRRWGVAELGGGALRVPTTFALLARERRLDPSALVRVLPQEPTLSALVRPLRTQLFSGNQLARAKGPGVEVVDLRDYRAGDPLRAINWRATSRRGRLISNQYQPERNADVTILLDCFGNGRRAGATTFDDAVRAASALVRHAIRERDRVGLISLAGTLSWIELRSGVRHFYRIVAALLESEVAARQPASRLPFVPRRVLSPGALVIALTSLLDERTVDILLGLRAQGRDLLVVEVVPDPDVRQLTTDEQSAVRFWRVVREALRARFVLAGIPVVRWRPAAELDEALAEVRAYRRRPQHVQL